MRRTIVTLSLAAAVFILAVFTPAAGAIATEDGQSAQDDSTTRTLQTTHTETQQRGERLDAAKKRICAQRQTAINALMDRRVSRAEKHLEVFNTIFDRVTAFYSAKGKVAANYDSLVTLAQVSRSKVTASITVLKAIPDFNCEDDTPKDTAILFRDTHALVWEDFMQYRSALTELIVAVKHAQGGN